MLKFDSPTVADLFCGAGGLTLGLWSAGFRCLKGFDNWPPAVSTFRRNICTQVEAFDLRTHPAIPDCDVIVGGPPCQGFSSAGLRDDTDERNTFVDVFAEIVVNRLPKAFIFENVEGFLTAGGGTYVQSLLGPLLSAGYFIHLRKENAANLGNCIRFYPKIVEGWESIPAFLLNRPSPLLASSAPPASPAP